MCNFGLNWAHIISPRRVVFLEKSHTCVEGGGTPQNFCLAFIDELQKQLLIKKLKKWAKEKSKNFDINVALFFVNRKSIFEI